MKQKLGVPEALMQFRSLGKTTQFLRSIIDTDDLLLSMVGSMAKALKR